MESFNINLNQTTETGNRYKKFLVILMVLFLAAAILSFLILNQQNDPREWIFLAFGIYGLGFIYFAYAGRKAKIYFKADAFAIEYQFGFFLKTPTSIMWDVIKKIRLGPTYITFSKKSGKDKKVQLGWLPYTKVIEIKDKVNSFAQSKGIDIEIAEFSKE
jgi:hypothetical protein